LTDTQPQSVRAEPVEAPSFSSSSRQGKDRPSTSSGRTAGAGP